jgi:hypothetical protein
MATRSTTAGLPNRFSARANVASDTRLFPCSSLEKSYTISSSSLIPVGRRPSRMASITSGLMPAFAAIGAWRYHS